jgi:hypothetical protein
MRGLRNPANRAVEFYSSKLWPGMLPNALPIVAENQRIIKPIQLVWKWSNFGQTKQRAARWLGLFGELFIKVAERGPDLPAPTPEMYSTEYQIDNDIPGRPGVPGAAVAASDFAAVEVDNADAVLDGPPDAAQERRVFFQVLDPRTVTEFTVDERGVITYIRLDVMREVRQGSVVRQTWWTEVWTRDAIRIWEHEKGYDYELSRLGVPNIRNDQNNLGFVPIVYAPLRDVGDERGMGCFTHAIDKIDEVNRQATRLHQMLFRYNRPIWALEANMMDPTGRPLPAPRIGANAADENTMVDFGGDPLVRLPGMSKLTTMIPPVDYNAALTIMNAQIAELEHELPEIRYYRLTEIGGGQSGIALRYMLSDALDRITEARGNAYAALARANQIALTMGQTAGLKPFQRIGTYNNGDFEHDFIERAVIPPSPLEEAQMMQLYTASQVPMKIAAKRIGWSAGEIAEMEKERDAEDARSTKKTVDNALALQQIAPKEPEGEEGGTRQQGTNAEGRAPRPVAAAPDARAGGNDATPKPRTDGRG